MSRGANARTPAPPRKGSARQTLRVMWRAEQKEYRMRTSEVLNTAADLIQQRGWVQGSWQSDSGLCLEGAVMAAMGVNAVEDGDGINVGLFDECAAGAAVLSYLRDGHRFPCEYAFTFNDAKDRTAAEVIEVLRACAVIEDAKEQQPAPVSVAS